VPNLEVLRPDVLTGTTGLAMVFADLFVATGEDTWRTAAIRAIDPSVRSWNNEIDRARQGSPSLVSAGAHYGVGAWVWALDRIGRAVDDPALADALQAGRQMVADRLRTAPFEAGIVSGHTGLLVASLSAFPEIVDQSLVDAITPALLAGLDAGTRRSTKAEHGLGSLPGPAASAAIALARLDRLFSLDPSFDLRGVLDRWAAPHLAAADGDRLPAGTLLALIEVAPLMDGDTSVRALCDQWIATQLEHNDPWRLLDVIDIALAAERISGTTGTGEAARIAAGRLLGMHDRHGSWFPGAWADDRHTLSAIWGQAAVAHALVRLGPSTGIDSLRLPG
jgi:hypothetical protein